MVENPNRLSVFAVLSCGTLLFALRKMYAISEVGRRNWKWHLQKLDTALSISQNFFLFVWLS